MEILYSSVGTLRYFQGDFGYKLIVEIDPQIMEYYRSLLPKYIKTNKQKYAPHISAVRKEVPNEYWGKYEGEKIDFYYSPIIQFGKVYCWLNCYCKRLEAIRLELGLPVSSPYTRPPEGFEKTFHVTLGNFKEHPQAHRQFQPRLFP